MTVKDADTKKAAGEMLQNARNAMEEMTRQLAEAKDVLHRYVEDEELDVDNEADVQEAKRRYQSSLRVTVIEDPAVRGAKALME
ncbi:MAG: hypothetical protein GC185_02515, partial [Alphaproteobacteria bacterium]|nr:hypothetical protein [Alphaproteobacteria bacterium]